ncbi:MAG TPA: hypothetical protein VGR13_01175 [Actinomycetota bacterium]|nr:hypothetical protein [Actinomycetota bacterium]
MIAAVVVTYLAVGLVVAAVTLANVKPSAARVDDLLVGGGATLFWPPWLALVLIGLVAWALGEAAIHLSRWWWRTEK